MKTLVVSLLIGVLVFELAEHVILPLLWLLLKRRKVSMCDVQSMVGQTAEVKHWKGKKGKVELGGELWNATSHNPIVPGLRVVIEDVDGLLLKVKSEDTG